MYHSKVSEFSIDTKSEIYLIRFSIFIFIFLVHLHTINLDLTSTRMCSIWNFWLGEVKIKSGNFKLSVRVFNIWSAKELQFKLKIIFFETDYLKAKKSIIPEDFGTLGIFWVSQYSMYLKISSQVSGVTRIILFFDPFRPILLLSGTRVLFKKSKPYAETRIKNWRWNYSILHSWFIICLLEYTLKESILIRNKLHFSIFFFFLLFFFPTSSLWIHKSHLFDWRVTTLIMCLSELWLLVEGVRII